MRFPTPEDAAGTTAAQFADPPPSCLFLCHKTRPRTSFQVTLYCALIKPPAKIHIINTKPALFRSLCFEECPSSCVPGSLPHMHVDPCSLPESVISPLGPCSPGGGLGKELKHSHSTCTHCARLRSPRGHGCPCKLLVGGRRGLWLWWWPRPWTGPGTACRGPRPGRTSRAGCPR